MIAATRIESGSAIRAGISTCLVCCDCQFRTADSAKYSFRIKLLLRPNFWFVISFLFMAGKAWIVLFTALELDRNDIQIRMPMLTARLVINRLTIDIDSFDFRSYNWEERSLLG
ncbi:hypothetical protein C8N25_10257 [Algoriphagus antarcticus]|uniref:Uncharacterized protein n=1 Tax=Algoriphagus antarcticus TaxID=238540 RepID=A0A3E0E5V4_9BACT|nr:hypothetical protein C8N25_10257 [Algoriphagus antarcticus]